MNTNQQFAVSCHILAVLAAYPTTLVTSETIAESVDTHPVVIRRIMAHLRQHGLVDSRPGASGGWRLLRPAAEISLREVYRAISHEEALAMHQHPNQDCPIGSKIQGALGDVFDEAQTALETALEKFSVANLLENILRETSQPA
ncbi:MAG: Rrf2 family transcriptional regulator [Chloroflexi bacterium]|nr:Rrf2 family transcriptional regulator [Chloroflexota bacterium]